ncbi:MAG: type I DNA topoisomerase [Anaerolineae bacterium]|nr:type I DNA topoisomerase [Anaerolineae bacterium]
MNTLIIVESPTKAKTLRGYLGRDTLVRASMGHVRDLPPKELGVDVAADFKPSYRQLRGKQKTIQALREAILKVDRVVLATDPDREGEAIAWHIVQVCRDQLRGKELLRARFHEITPEAVRAALAQPEALNMDLVDAQQARRVLDRLVGYEISPVLWKGVAGPKGLSAGRVQTVALRLVVERDREIEAFVPQEYWTLDAELSPLPDGTHFVARLWRLGREKAVLSCEAEALAVVEALQGADWRVGELEQKKQTRKPFPPYTTSTLQRDASNRLHWPAKKTMQIAQQLYEGVKLPDEKTTGLITYMRTDSTAVSPGAAEEAREVIRRYFPDSLPDRQPVYPSQVKNAQEAHEAIRPTSSARTPREIREALSPDQDRLYTLIWQRFIASQMKPARFQVTVVTVATARGGQPLPYWFRATGRELLDPGFLAVYQVEEAAPEGEAPDQELPPLSRGELLRCHQLLPQQRFTKPPPHYTEASLIQKLEKEGIGRPSTFASILDTLYRRQYVRQEGKALVSSSLGKTVSDFLLAHFASVFELPFTARMEAQLDEIANGRTRWQGVMRSMWGPLSERVEGARSALVGQPKIQVPGYDYTTKRRGQSRRRPEPELMGEACPQCGEPLVRRKGKHGPFVGCSAYPACRYTRSAREG